MFENMPGGGNGAAAPQVVNRGQAPAGHGGVNPGANAVAPVAAPAGGDDAPDATSIAGISALKGVILYGATLTFAALYAYFITRILGAETGSAAQAGRRHGVDRRGAGRSSGISIRA